MWCLLNLLKGIFIGYGNFGKSLLTTFDSSGFVYWLGVYSPKGNDHPRNTNDISEYLSLSDFVVIACPDPFHIDWIEYLSAMHYPGYIFCEKSPVTDSAQLQRLKKVKNLKIYFNFPLIFTDFFQTQQQRISDNKLAIVNWGHDFAFKPHYKDSWRARGDLTPYGVGTSLAIHFLHQTLYVFGKIKVFAIEYSKLSPAGTSPDTVKISTIFQSEMCVDIFCSYGIPETQSLFLGNKKEFLFLPENQIENEQSTLSYTSQNNGFQSKIIKNRIDPFIFGNLSSVNFFLKAVQDRTIIVQDIQLIYDALQILFSKTN